MKKRKLRKMRKSEVFIFWFFFQEKIKQGKTRKFWKSYFNIINDLIVIIFITFFYINRRKYWFRANFRFPVFDVFTCFGVS